MIYLIDSCVIINNLTEASKIIDIQKKVTPDNLAVSNVIIDELKVPLKSQIVDDKIETLIRNLICQNKIKLIDINTNSSIKQRFEDIRKRYYKWTTNPEYINILIQKGKINPEDRKSLKYKDLGECSLIAIALEDVEENIIVTNDKGRVYLHPDTNIFKLYSDVKVMNYKEFSQYILSKELKV